MRESATIEKLVDELMKVSGWGVEPNRLATKPVLNDLAEVEPSLSRVTAGCIIERYIVDELDALAGIYEFDGRRYNGRTMRAAYLLELGIGTARKARWRQYQLMRLLGLDYSYDQWRKQIRLKRTFLRVLAEHMMKRANRHITM